METGVRNRNREAALRTGFSEPPATGCLSPGERVRGRHPWQSGSGEDRRKRVAC